MWTLCHFEWKLGLARVPGGAWELFSDELRVMQRSLRPAWEAKSKP
jgi:hypothetical protein